MRHDMERGEDANYDPHGILGEQAADDDFTANAVTAPAAAVAEPAHPRDVLPELTWLGRLRNAEDEQAFRTRLFRPLFERRVIVVGALCTLLTLVDALGQRFVIAERDVPHHLVAMLLVPAAFGAFTLAHVIARALALPYDLVQCLSCGWLGGTAVLWCSVVSELRFAALCAAVGHSGCGREGDGAAAERGPLYTNSPCVLRLLVLLALFCSYVPYAFPPFCAFVLLAVGGSLALELGLPLPSEPRDALSNLALLLVLALMAVSRNWAIGRTARRRFLLRRAASDGARERKLAEAAHATQQLKLVSAKAAKEARSRLIRMVRGSRPLLLLAGGGAPSSAAQPRPPCQPPARPAAAWPASLPALPQTKRA